MCNGKFYKRFCAIAVSLGVVLSVGQYSYAHSPELLSAEADAKVNPTMTTLGRLCDLYEKDVEYHNSRKEYDEAKKSEDDLLSTRKKLDIILKVSCGMNDKLSCILKKAVLQAASESVPKIVRRTIEDIIIKSATREQGKKANDDSETESSDSSSLSAGDDPDYTRINKNLSLQIKNIVIDRLKEIRGATSEQGKKADSAIQGIKFNGVALKPDVNKVINIDMFDKVYPVGSIYMSVNSVNPSTWMKGTTWVIWGSGRVPVGVNLSDTEFSTVEKTGGEKSVVLGENHLPMGVATDFWRPSGESGAAYGNGEPFWAVAGATHTGRIHTQGHSNLQPYITCYMWKRTS